jgi:uroporphyrinogen decarboxylase
VTNEEQVYDYYDDPEPFEEASRAYLERMEKRFMKLMSLETRPDFICTGGSGTLVYQTVEMFRRLGLPVVKRITELCREYGIPSHVHSCGPEKELIRICHDETALTVIDPLEIPPMGDCDLKQIKHLYGDTLVLKGNLHTTNVMLRGTPEDVARASRQAIDDGAAGGRFILSTGDQCGRDTPDENIFAMIETARTYGRYA